MTKNHRNITLEIKNCLEENNEKNEIIEKNGKISKFEHQFDRKEVARRRWGLLAKALKSPISSQPSSPTDEISLRRFSTFSLLTPEPLEITDSPADLSNFEVIKNGENWYEYSTIINGERYSIQINHLIKNFTAEDLMGFNNTGNVCVWPSEESLTYYILKNLDIFHQKSVLELGAGMSALAGLFVAKYGSPKQVLLTDGNNLAVENISKSLTKNKFCTNISSTVLKWGKTNLTELYDIILSADCLFFDEARLDLINTIYDTLKFDGVAFIMAPRRGGTLDIFQNAAQNKGFKIDKYLIYDHEIWERHLEFLKNFEYNEDIHYPVLLKLTK